MTSVQCAVNCLPAPPACRAILPATSNRSVLNSPPQVGVEPEVKRIGKFKSAGDQLLRRDMSDAQREQLTALLDDIYEDFVACVARSRGKSREEVCVGVCSRVGGRACVGVYM